MLANFITNCIHRLISLIHGYSIWSSLIITWIVVTLVAFGIYRFWNRFKPGFAASRNFEKSIKRELRKEKIRSLTGDISDDGTVNIFHNPSGPQAFTLGLWKPEIFISSRLLENCDDSTLDIIIQHEKGHLKRRDPLRRLILAAMADIFWFIPALGELLRRVWLNGEFYCDSMAVCKGHEPIRIARVLVDVAGMNSSGTDGINPAVSSFVDDLEARVKALTGAGPARPKPMKKAILGTSIVIVLMALGNLGTAFIHTADPGGLHSSIENLSNSCRLSAPGEICSHAFCDIFPPQ